MSFLNRRKISANASWLPTERYMVPTFASHGVSVKHYPVAGCIRRKNHGETQNLTILSPSVVGSCHLCQV